MNSEMLQIAGGWIIIKTITIGVYEVMKTKTLMVIVGLASAVFVASQPPFFVVGVGSLWHTVIGSPFRVFLRNGNP